MSSETKGPQPPAEAQRCTCPSGDGSLRWPCPVHPPSAPVGVEAVVADMRRWVRLVEAAGPYAAGRTAVMQEWANQLEALAQQPAADGGFTAADMMDARQEGRREAQQPAAVDEAMVERACKAAVAQCSPNEVWPDDYSEADDLRAMMQAALTEALAAQQGDSHD